MVKCDPWYLSTSFSFFSIIRKFDKKSLGMASTGLYRGDIVLTRRASKTEAEKIIVKKEEEDACEMECSDVRFYDVRSSKGRLPFLKKVGLFQNTAYFKIILFSSFLTFLSLLCTGSTKTRELRLHTRESSCNLFSTSSPSAWSQTRAFFWTSD